MEVGSVQTEIVDFNLETNFKKRIFNIILNITTDHITMSRPIFSKLLHILAINSLQCKLTFRCGFDNCNMSDFQIELNPAQT